MCRIAGNAMAVPVIGAVLATELSSMLRQLGVAGILQVLDLQRHSVPHRVLQSVEDEDSDSGISRSVDGSEKALIFVPPHHALHIHCGVDCPLTIASQAFPSVRQNTSRLCSIWGVVY